MQNPQSSSTRLIAFFTPQINRAETGVPEVSGEQHGAFRSASWGLLPKSHFAHPKGFLTILDQYGAKNPGVKTKKLRSLFY
jgi:hypothetical protein